MTSSTRDWFRKTTWSADDERDFRAHLKRARVDRRPQYLRIQAAHLLENGLPEPALVLLDEFLAAPDDLFLPLGHSLRAQASTTPSLPIEVRWMRNGDDLTSSRMRRLSSRS